MKAKPISKRRHPPRRAPRPGRRGSALLVIMVLLPVLLYAGMITAERAADDVQIAASGRRDVITYGAAEGAVAEVLSDGRITLAPPAGFAPDPGDPLLAANYPPITTVMNTTANTEVRFLRQGPVLESSALDVRSLVYEVGTEVRYANGGGRVPVTVEFYRIAPVLVGHVPRPRHYH